MGELRYTIYKYLGIAQGSLQIILNCIELTKKQREYLENAFDCIQKASSLTSGYNRNIIFAQVLSATQNLIGAKRLTDLRGEDIEEINGVMINLAHAANTIAQEIAHEKLKSVDEAVRGEGKELLGILSGSVFDGPIDTARKLVNVIVRTLLKKDNSQN